MARNKNVNMADSAYRYENNGDAWQPNRPGNVKQGNRPRSRETKVDGAGKSVYRRGEGLNTDTYNGKTVAHTHAWPSPKGRRNDARRAAQSVRSRTSAAKGSGKKTK